MPTDPAWQAAVREGGAEFAVIYGDEREFGAMFEAAFRRALATLERNGYVLAPKEATEEMLAIEHSPMLVLGNAGNDRVQQWRAGIYKGMIASRPALPPEGEG